MSFSNQTVFSVQSFAGDEDLVCIWTYVSVKEISASWKLFASNSILRVSFFRCFLIFLSESGLFLSESFLSNPFLISFQDHFPQTSLSTSSVSRYTVRLQELFQKRPFEELHDQHQHHPKQYFLLYKSTNINLNEFFAQIIKVVKLMYKKGSPRNGKHRILTRYERIHQL